MDTLSMPPVVITGGARRVGLALALSLLARELPVLVAYRSEYPALASLRQAGLAAYGVIFLRQRGSMISPRRCSGSRLTCGH